VAAVVFAFGNRPEINDADALDLADFLTFQDNPVGHHAAAKIRSQAIRDPDREIRCDVELNPDEMATLLALLDEPALEDDAIENLRQELAKALERADQPPGDTEQ
jgi:hypothetical protein